MLGNTHALYHAFDTIKVDYPTMTRTIILNGDELNISHVASLAENQNVKILLGDSVAPAVERAKSFLDQHMATKIIYGVNTGFGPMASHLIGKKALVELQYNLIKSHAVGMGEPIAAPYVLAAMLVRLNTLSKGYSGVSMDLVEHLRSVLNHRIIPEIPEHGAVGTSGDLVQLAHIALALIGKGYVTYKDERMPALRALTAAGLKPYELKPKEGLSLINGTSVMSGITALACRDLDRLLSLATRTGAWALELIGGFDDSIAQEFHYLRPHEGQMAIAQSLRELIADSRMTKRRDKFQTKHRLSDKVRLIDEEVQEIYSFRCIPQLLGPALDTLLQSRGIVQTEINSATDNPVVDAEHERFWHGGHFHGEYVAMASDQMRASLAKMMLLSERRINFFLNDKTNSGRLPPFLNMVKPGLTLALQGLQFVATSTAARGQTLAYPHRIHSIPTNGDNQDVVSMGTDSALLTMKAIDDAYILASIELITLAQATDVLGVRRRLSKHARELYLSVREQMKAIKQDRELVDELPSVVQLARTSRDIPLKWYVSSRKRLFS
jgi:histidine ammonia-lyase